MDIDWLHLGMGLFGGLALFLGGLEQLSEGLKQAAGQTLKVILARLTTNRLMGALTGALVTGILNSSSVTTVLVVGFVTAG
jgi:phosphate:Na+ symporter